MDNMEKYRAKINRYYRQRRTAHRYVEGGRRKVDYKSPPWFTWGEGIQLFLLIASSVLLLFLTGCL